MSEIGKKRRVRPEIDFNTEDGTKHKRSALLNQSFSSDDSGVTNSPRSEIIDSDEDFDE